MTQRILQKRINEHSSCETSSVYRHAQLTNHDINFASPSILAHDNVNLRLQIKETLPIKDESAFNSLNENIGSFPLIPELPSKSKTGHALFDKDLHVQKYLNLIEQSDNKPKLLFLRP